MVNPRLSVSCINKSDYFLVLRFSSIYRLLTTAIVSRAEQLGSSVYVQHHSSLEKINSGGFLRFPGAQKTGLDSRSLNYPCWST